MSRRNLQFVAFLCSFVSMFVASALAGEPPVKAVRPDGIKNRAAWMAQGSFGVMTHYLIAPKDNTPEEGATGHSDGTLHLCGSGSA
jgi:hypothetical protein